MKILAFVLPFWRSHFVRSRNLPSIVTRGSGCAAVGLFCLLSAFRAWSADCVSPPAGLVAWWPGEGNANDIAGTNNGTLLNGASASATGLVGQAFSLDGADDYVDVGDFSALDNASEITVMAWIRRSDLNNSESGIIGKWGGGGPAPGGPGTFLLYTGEYAWGTVNKGSFWVYLQDQTVARVDGTTEFPVNEWVHIAGTWRSSDGAIALYKNGHVESVGTGGLGKRLYGIHDFTAVIGAWSSSYAFTGYLFKGQIDEVAIFNRALSASEIASIYASGSAGMCKGPKPRISVARTGQRVAYRMGDDGDLGRGVCWARPRFTDNGDGTVTDNNTGLIWLKNANPCDSKRWSEAIDFAQTLASGTAGLTDGSQAGDWRVPNDRELFSLLDFGNHHPALPADHPFVGAVTNYYWVSTTMSGADNALGLSLDTGEQITWGKEVNPWHVWPVRGTASPACPAPPEKTGATNSFRPGDDGFHQEGLLWASPRFGDGEDGTVTDLNTGLIWLKQADPCGPTNWNQAVDYARRLGDGVAGLSDGSQPGEWRLPNVRELFSLFDLGRQPVLPAGHPFTNVPAVCWASTTAPADTNMAYLVSIYDANMYAAAKTEPHFLWPVREPGTTLLRAEKVGSAVRLSWPTIPGGFCLQSRGSLGTGDAWSPVEQWPAVSNGEYYIWLDHITLQRFFRLSRTCSCCPLAPCVGSCFNFKAYSTGGSLCSIGRLDINFQTNPVSGTSVLQSLADCGGPFRQGSGPLEGQYSAGSLELNLTPGWIGTSLWLHGQETNGGFAGTWESTIITFPPVQAVGAFVAERISLGP